MYDEFKENITRTNEGRFQVKLPWSPNHPKLKFNEQPARRRLQNTMRKLSNDPETKLAYDQIIEQQLNEGIIEYAPKTSKEERVFYMPHKPVVRKQATTTKVRMVHDASSKPEEVSLTQCLYIGPNLQPWLFDILARMRILHPIWITGDVKQAFYRLASHHRTETLWDFFIFHQNRVKNFIWDSHGCPFVEDLAFLAWEQYSGGYGMKMKTNFQRLLRKWDWTPTLTTSTKVVAKR